MNQGVLQPDASPPSHPLSSITNNIVSVHSNMSTRKILLIQGENSYLAISYDVLYNGSVSYAHNR